VGPESAGADPGPACYGRGGAAATVTDANLLLGRYDPARFAGGAMQLHRDPAAMAMTRCVGDRIGLEPAMAALGIIEMVDENMANAARVHAIESGKSYGGRTLIAFGGGGPVHGYRVAEKVGIDRVLVPIGAGVGSAIGFLRAPVGYEVVRSRYGRLGTYDVRGVNALLDDMTAEAEEVVAGGSFGAPTRHSRLAFMRYVGQGHEIPVTLPDRSLQESDIAALRQEFDAAYARFYDRPVPGSDVEVMSYAVTVTTVPEAGTAGPPPVGASAAPGEQRVRDTATGDEAAWAVHQRADLAAGQQIAGPAIVAEAETSTLIGPGWSATVDERGYLDLRRIAA
jgi:N-methylhydantoinase A